MQKFKSAGTSVNCRNPPRLFRRVTWKPGINIDIGGGKFDTATEFLRGFGVENHIYDPYNRSDDHNQRVLKLMQRGVADSVTLANVLNIVKEPEEREKILRLALTALKPGGMLYVWVYEGNASGVGRETKRDCWQVNQWAEFYVPEIAKLFTVEKVTKQMIWARKA